MKNRITELFTRKQKDVLSVFFTAGYPRLDDTVLIAKSLEDAGVDLIEVGIPFSDPVADGPVIQESNKIALDNGMQVTKLFAQVTEIRRHCKLPIILMGYVNPVMQYGIEKFCSDASRAGVDGSILPDLPLDEFQQDYRAAFDANSLQNTFLISPTTSDDRIRLIDEASSGFIYAVSASSTTGARREFSEEQERYFERLKAMKLRHPFLVGFGVSNRATFAKACEFGAGAIVGSAFINILKNSHDLAVDIKSFVAGLRGGNGIS